MLASPSHEEDDADADADFSSESLMADVGAGHEAERGGRGRARGDGDGGGHLLLRLDVLAEDAARQREPPALALHRCHGNTCCLVSWPGAAASR